MVDAPLPTAVAVAVAPEPTTDTAVGLLLPKVNDTPLTGWPNESSAAAVSATLWPNASSVADGGARVTLRTSVQIVSCAEPTSPLGPVAKTESTPTARGVTTPSESTDAI